MSFATLRLRQLPGRLRLGLACLLLVNAGGFVAAGLHMVEHHQNRDGKAGLSLDDVRGAYHGVSRVAPLLLALQRNHPEELAPGSLSAAQRASLLAWLGSERITEDYDNLDLESPPADVLDQSCLGCHARTAPAEKKVEPFLDYWDDVKSQAFSSEVKPASEAILLASTHTHAIALATIGIVLSLLLAFTSSAARLGGLAALAMGAGLALDIASMWLARSSAGFVYCVLVGGGCFNAGVALATLLLWIELARRE